MWTLRRSNQHTASQALETVATGRYAAIRMSPDGTRAAIAVMDESGSRDIWKMDLARGLLSRLSTTGGNVAVWSRDGGEIAYHDSTTLSIRRGPTSEPHRVSRTSPFVNGVQIPMLLSVGIAQLILSNRRSRSSLRPR